MPASPSLRRPRDALISALRIGLAYLVVGGLWIWLSDALVVAISEDTMWLVAAQRYKGLVYIVVTAGGLVYLVHRSYERLLAAQLDVERSQLRVADLFEQHPQPMWVQDPSTCRFLRVNEAAIQTYGYSRAEFLCMATRDIWPEADVPSFPGEFHSPTLGALARGVSRHRTKDGRLILARLTEHQLELDGLPALMVRAEDVTREALIVEALQRQQQQQQQLKKCLRVALWIGSEDRQRLTYVSQSLQEVAGLASAQLQSDPAAWLSKVHPDDLPGVPALLSSDSHGNASPRRWLYRIVMRDGTHRWIEDERCEVHDSAGKLTVFGGLLRDVTEHFEPPAT